MLLGNHGPGKAEGVETSHSGGGPNLIRSGLVIDVIEAIGLSGDDVQRILLGAIVSPFNLLEGKEKSKKIGCQKERRRSIVRNQHM